jgi:SAM-dependent methyltransferase
MCGGAAFAFVHRFEARPEGENDFGFTPYRRELWRCGCCGHLVNRHDFPLERLYVENYVDAVYGARLEQNFAHIMALPPERSDNRQRAQRIEAYVAARAAGLPRRALDVGAGLGVFPAALAEAGWDCLAIDPDPRVVAHIEAHTRAAARCGDFTKLKAERRFALVSFNKVLEHVRPMAAMLARSKEWLMPKGLVYVELPDGEAALDAGPTREEFFVEHYCAFSLASFALLVAKAGLRAERVERIREPSGKYTLYGFLSAA